MGTPATHSGDKKSNGLAENLPALPSLLAWHFVMALLCGAILVVTPFELLFFVLPAWMIAGAILFIASQKRNQGLRVAATLLIQFVTVVAVVLAAANYLPAKTGEVMQDELSATLPKPIMSLAEIKVLVEEPDDREGFLRMVQFADEQSGLEAEVRFPDRHVTLRQFITEINRQTTFEAHLSGGCGNGSTILYGVAPYWVLLRQR